MERDKITSRFKLYEADYILGIGRPKIIVAVDLPLGDYLLTEHFIILPDTEIAELSGRTQYHLNIERLPDEIISVEKLLDGELLAARGRLDSHILEKLKDSENKNLSVRMSYSISEIEEHLLISWYVSGLGNALNKIAMLSWCVSLENGIKILKNNLRLANIVSNRLG